MIYYAFRACRTLRSESDTFRELFTHTRELMSRYSLVVQNNCTNINYILLYYINTTKCVVFAFVTWKISPKIKTCVWCKTKNNNNHNITCLTKTTHGCEVSRDISALVCLRPFASVGSKAAGSSEEHGSDMFAVCALHATAARRIHQRLRRRQRERSFKNVITRTQSNRDRKT